MPSPFLPHWPRHEAVALFRRLWLQKPRCRRHKVLKGILLRSQIPNCKENIPSEGTRKRVSCFLSAPLLNRKWIRPCSTKKRREGVSLCSKSVCYYGIQMAAHTDIRASALWRFHQSNNMSIESESEGKCYFVPFYERSSVRARGTPR